MLKLEVGRKYETRAGEIVEIIYINTPHKSFKYPAVGIRRGEFNLYTFTYTLDGVFDLDSPISSMTLVKELPKFKSGETWLTRGDDEAVIVSVNSESVIVVIEPNTDNHESFFLNGDGYYYSIGELNDRDLISKI
jgi:hypothetical protein